jgi:phosphatidylinositol kinase/protein kinase (PI-3  family)
LDKDGHLIHIDFGFMLSNSPGSVGFEMAPFKMPQDYIDILGGLESSVFSQFRGLMKAAFLALRKKSDHIIGIVEMMEKGSSLACFTGTTLKPTSVPSTPTGPMTAAPETKVNALSVTEALRERFQLSLTDAQISEFVDRLIDSSCNSMFTRLYDSFQVNSQEPFMHL